jgi:hypothetical protein
MSESTTKLFWGDGEREDENPQDFMNAVERSFNSKNNLSDTNKLRQFVLNLKSGSVAKQWWNDLPPTDKDTWDHLQSAFETKWPEKAVTVKTLEEKQALLEGTKLADEDIGKRVKVNGVEEFAHVVWADKIQRLAAAVPDTNGLLIPTIRRSMPKVLRRVIGTGHTAWSAFCNAVRAVSLSEIEEARELENEQKQIREDVKKIQEQSTPSKALGNAFQRASLGPPIPAPRFNPPKNFIANNQHIPIPQATSNNPFATHTPQPRSVTASYQQTRPDIDRMTDVLRLALPIHPDNPAGHALYHAQISEWNRNHGNRPVNEYRPYPLSPGTSPVASGECWMCGYIGHVGNCTTTSPVPPLERRWRSIASTIKRNAEGPTANVNYVAQDDRWFEREDYDRQVIANYLLSQGKGPGSSM